MSVQVHHRRYEYHIFARLVDVVGYGFGEFPLGRIEEFNSHPFAC